jgi:hypothetical protein
MKGEDADRYFCFWPKAADLGRCSKSSAFLDTPVVANLVATATHDPKRKAAGE